LLCMSDELALAALAAAAGRGFAVPGDLSVVGFDDTPPARWARPPLTTVRQDLVGKGRLAGELARHLLAGGRVPGPAIVDIELVVRGSTGPPPRTV
jgi:DNA-binding LacI/PurR family transcriptional regulator